MSEPTIRELLDQVSLTRADGLFRLEHELAERVEAVLKLHKESDSTFAGKPWCSMCKDAQNNHVDWPCATVRALEGK